MYLLILDSDILGFTYPQLSEGTEAQDESLHKLYCGRIDNLLRGWQCEFVHWWKGIANSIQLQFSDEPLATN